MALALIRLGKISVRSRPGTGPAPRANVKTNLRERRKKLVEDILNNSLLKHHLLVTLIR
jgi:hypothetical protein